MAAWWQIHRAEAGNTLSYLYAVEWPAFIVVAAIGWWQLVHDTPEDIARRREEHERVRRASAEVVARTLPRSALAVTVDATEVEGRPAALVAPGSGEAPPAPLPVPARRRALDVLEAAAAGGDPDEPVDALTAYNQYLARLAVRGRPKTWRNPRGE